jgi:uncharacterized protein (TIGR02147 family)
VSVKSEKATIREATKVVSVTRFLSYRDYLAEVYEYVKSATENYSYLQFAEDLGFSKTNVIRLVIAGERPLTEKAADKASKFLDLKGIDRKYWLAMVRYNNERLPAEREKHFKDLMAQKQREIPQEIDQKHLEYFTEWYYPVVREVVSLAGFDGDPEWIRARIGFPLRLEEIKRALELLEKLDFIKRDQVSGQLVATKDHVVTERELDSLGIVRYHQKMIEMGREAITRIDEEQRDIRAMTFRLSQAQTAAAKAKIDELLSELIKMETAAGLDGEVYQLNIQLFPFTKNQG